MATSRPYFVDSGAVSIGGTVATPALYGAAPAGADFDIAGIRVSVVSGGSPAPPTNASIFAALAVVSGTVGGGATAAARPVGQSTLAAQSTWKSGSTALTGLTEGNVLWSHNIPYAAGASWGEWFPSGFERNVPATGLIAVYFTASAAGSGMSFEVTLDLAE